MKRHKVALTLILLAMTSTTLYQQSDPFIPADFNVPKLLETDHFRIRMLTVNDVVKDYDAVMSSTGHLRGVFGPNSAWPEEELSLEQDLIDLGWHQKEFQRRTSFAYTVMNPDESQCLGCVYIDPTTKTGYDAEVYLWVRKSAFDRGLDPVLFRTVKDWVSVEWPFGNVAYPGRDITWEEWERLPVD
jgi:hypothetical protein